MRQLPAAFRHKPEPPPPGPEDYKKWMVALAPVLTYGRVVLVEAHGRGLPRRDLLLHVLVDESLQLLPRRRPLPGPREARREELDEPEARPVAGVTSTPQVKRT